MIRGKKGNQMDVIPYMLRLALLIPHPLFYLQNSQRTQDLIIFFLRKRESERASEREKSQNLFIREAVIDAHFFKST